MEVTKPPVNKGFWQMALAGLDNAAITPSTDQSNFFLMCMHELTIKSQQSGIVLAISTLINSQQLRMNTFFEDLCHKYVRLPDFRQRSWATFLSKRQASAACARATGTNQGYALLNMELCFNILETCFDHLHDYVEAALWDQSASEHGFKIWILRLISQISRWIDGLEHPEYNAIINTPLAI
jgi:hypothetical protein